MVNRAFQALGKNPGLAIVPVAMDLLSFVLGFMFIGFIGEPRVSLKLTLDIGLPSVSTVLENTVMADVLHFDSGGAALLLFIFFFVLGAFVEGGFFGLLIQLAKMDEAPTLQNFLDYAQRFWLRFLGLKLIVFLVAMAGLFLASLLWIVGILAYVIGFIILRVLYIYWEVTLVSEDLGIGEAFNRSRQYLDKRSPELTQVVMAMLAVNLVAALFLNLLMFPVVIFVGIFIYNYVATGMLLALIFTMPEGIPVYPQEYS